MGAQLIKLIDGAGLHRPARPLTLERHENALARRQHERRPRRVSQPLRVYDLRVEGVGLQLVLGVDVRFAQKARTLGPTKPPEPVGPRDDAIDRQRSDCRPHDRVRADELVLVLLRDHHKAGSRACDPREAGEDVAPGLRKECAFVDVVVDGGVHSDSLRRKSAFATIAAVDLAVKRTGSSARASSVLRRRKRRLRCLV